jgi:hypothetical protein
MGTRLKLRLAQRIHLGALRRAGEILLKIAPAKGGQPFQKKKSTRGSTPPSRRQAAQAAGLSPDQQKTAQQVASVPADVFEAAVEGETLPTVTGAPTRQASSGEWVLSDGRQRALLTD